jgi:hypothetical protein
LTYDGRFAKAIAVIEDYMRRDPLYPAVAICWIGITLHMQGRYDEALAPLRKVQGSSS